MTTDIRSTTHRSSASGARTPARRGFPAVPLTIVATGALAAGVYWHDPLARLVGWDPHAAPGAAAQPLGTPKQLWTCGMHPQVIQDKPGLCPICHMQLVPLKAAADAANTPGASTPGQASQQPGAAGSTASSTPREVAYWRDPMMSPPYISDKPGKSPMGMDLVPVYKDQVSGGTAVAIDPVVVQNMGVRTVAAIDAPLHRTLRAVAYLSEPEPNQVDINLRVSGWVEKLYAHTPGMRVSKGDPLFELYSPDLQVAIEEAIAVRRARAGVTGQVAQETAEATLAAVRQKLTLLGLAEDQIGELIAAERAPRTVVFRSPIDGHITDKQGLFTGAAVKAGDRVLRLSDNSTLWLDAQVFERDLSQIAVGSAVTATTEFMPGRRFRGEVSFIHPHLDPATRTALVRITIQNPERELKQGMYATVETALAGPAAAVLIPRDAVLDTGKRQIVFLALPGGRFEPRRVEAGVEDDEGRVQVLAGLAPGDLVVTSGQFLLDSESRLREAVQKFLESKAAGAAGGGQGAAAPSANPPPAPFALSPAAQERVDAIVSAYLTLAESLGAVQKDAAPLKPGGLVAAIHALHGEVSGAEAMRLVSEAATAAESLTGKAIDQQREAFKSVSAKVIALIDAMPPSPKLAESLFVLNCPMAKADWLQRKADVANPYYADDMKECGSVVRPVATRKDGAK